MFTKKIKNWLKSIESKQNQDGFTLIEMMIVLAIIGMIMSFVGAKISQRYEEARISGTKIQIRQLGTVLDDFRRVCGRYPTTAEGLDALLKAPATIQCKNYDPEGFLREKKLPDDSWGKPFNFQSDGSKYVIKSSGGADTFDDAKKVISSDDL